MIHKNKDEFVKTLERAAKKKGFLVPLLEKDYYLTLILSRVHELSEDLIFKGGTCLNKVYYAYYRLSEDLDFSMKLPRYEATRGERRKCIQPVKDKISKFVEQFDMKIVDSGNPGRNESKQYVYYFSYQSALRPNEGQVKFEIGLRFNPIDLVEKRQVHHTYTHPFTGEPLFDGGKVACLSLNEIVSEKLRAAALRETIAPRDFYDLDFIIRNKFNITDGEVVKLFKKKIEEDGGDTDLTKYYVNMGRKNVEIEDMRFRIKAELFDVLSPVERDNFDLDNALERINKAMEGIK
ncbi:MAG: nucleotidyl transferase AbiEii/AbiGii toxin family protein [Candidatus Omnitrophica bacterium]|nr:nucleotidyl transferase AbiEii/AbiGii toxin family protein [Candidatus Omnitrophota bacterium]MBU4468670.1 nucleotidyl transferase AbiEii/AbiGii toxin family protein [Candidatus Omnitrophota bacterium]MCG2707784.1 nucleotidyl transferase AbiEii/AbiGii toxin family protein [Candidatus Omnitrophota bacterium]